VALVTRLKSRGRLKPKQIVVAAMRKLLVLCFGVLKTGKPFDLRETVPRNWADLCDSVTDNFRVINPKDFRVMT
jgi:hypothetical protein